MAERTIMGVDFSGGGKDTAVGNTWVTKGRFDGNTLTIHPSYPTPISRTKLRGLLCALPKGSVAALDFPFGVAREVFPDLKLGQSMMKEVWDRVSEMRFEDKDSVEGFDTLRAKHRKTKRRFDEKHYQEESFSPQDERMRYMTYRGIKMLKELHIEHCNRWHIPAIHCGRIREDRVTLLEVMPGAALNAWGFQDQYKRYKKNNGRDALKHLENRKYIIENLPDKIDIKIPNYVKYRDFFIFNDDAMDSFIAVITAALWANGTDFPLPGKDKDPNLRDAARLEGCIFAPSKLASSVR